MTAPFNVRPRTALLLALALSGIVAHIQATQQSSNNDSIAVSLNMQSNQIQIGQMPWAILTIYNISDQPLTIRDGMYRVYVYGKNGEAPTTLVQRQLTGRLRPSDAPLRADQWPGAVQTVWPAGGAGDSYVRKFGLAYLYDLSAPGRYTAYAGVMDPSSHRWLRTRMVTFEITASAHRPFSADERKTGHTEVGHS